VTQFAACATIAIAVERAAGNVAVEVQDQCARTDHRFSL